jgi:hypothetical protein
MFCTIQEKVSGIFIDCQILYSVHIYYASLYVVLSKVARSAGPIERLRLGRLFFCSSDFNEPLDDLVVGLPFPAEIPQLLAGIDFNPDRCKRHGKDVTRITVIRFAIRLRLCDWISCFDKLLDIR